MEVKIKKVQFDAVIPKYAKEGDAGLDLVAISKFDDWKYTEYNTGLAVQIPKGYVGLLFPRSSISNTVQFLANSVGVIDSGYTGEIKFRFRNLDKNSFSTYKVGDKIGQLVIVPCPQIELKEVDTLNDTERGTDGFGSSGT